MCSYCHAFILQWELVHHVRAKEEEVSVSYITASTSCNINYTVKGSLGVLLPHVFYFFHAILPFPRRSCHGVCLCHADPIPEFSLEVNPLSKSFNVSVDVADYPVYARWCYIKARVCKGNSPFLMQTFPSQPQSVVLDFPLLLPCVCMEVFPLLYNSISARFWDRLSGVSLSFPGLLQLQRCPS